MIALTRRARRRRALAVPFPDASPCRPVPDAWRQLLARRLVHWNLLDDDERARLEDLIRLFLVDKKWEGTAGFELTDDVRVLDRGDGLPAHPRASTTTPTTGSPGSRSSPPRCDGSARTSVGVGPVVSDSPVPLLGQASYAGPVTIAWDAANEGARHPERGHNVVYHEFAHKLDMARRPGRRHAGARHRRGTTAVDRGVHRGLRAAARGSGRRAPRSLRRRQPGRVLRRRHRDLLRPAGRARAGPSPTCTTCCATSTARIPPLGSVAPVRARARRTTPRPGEANGGGRRSSADQRGSAMASVYCSAYLSCWVQAQRTMLRSGSQA